MQPHHHNESHQLQPSPCGEMSATFVGDLTQIVILSFASKDSTRNLKRLAETDEISTLIQITRTLQFYVGGDIQPRSTSSYTQIVEPHYAVRPLRSSQLCMLKILTSIFFRYIFAFIYTSEMFLKIVARGFVLNSYTYLRNPWNWLDFTVVIMGYVFFFISTQQYPLMFWRQTLHHVPFRKRVVGYGCWSVARNCAGCTHTVFQTVTLICQIVFA